MALELVIDTRELDALAMRYAGAGVVVSDELERAMTESAIAVQSRARELAPVDTGRLRQSIGYEVRPGQGIVKAGSGSVVYAATMEYGRAPGSPMPPQGSLLGWMRRHGIPEELEYVVRRGIGRKGIRGRAYMQQGLQDSIDAVQGYFAEAVTRAAARLNG